MANAIAIFSFPVLAFGTVKRLAFTFTAFIIEPVVIWADLWNAYTFTEVVVPDFPGGTILWGANTSASVNIDVETFGAGSPNNVWFTLTGTALSAPVMVWRATVAGGLFTETSTNSCVKVKRILALRWFTLAVTVFAVEVKAFRTLLLRAKAFANVTTKELVASWAG